VELRTNSLPGALEGRIASISPSADPRTRLFPIEILLPNAERRIKPGFLATIFLPDEEQGGVLCLPLGSVMKGAGADSLYVVFTIEKQGERTVARERHVKLGEIAGNQIIILEGLRAGEAVVTLGATHLKEGSPVLLVP
jgi:multidrug efflux system membrane fusion protein